jgi:Tol biopolymer transport system component
MDADGSNLRRLTDFLPPSGFNTYSDPDFSPDGQHLVVEAGFHDITVMNADGSEPTLITDGASPNFSPDGQRIAFGKKPSGLPARVLRRSVLPLHD